jgi:cellulose synthase/poly-beta-1,6-N-acetylglucosamine synthase-like glycosyltransferase
MKLSVVIPVLNQFPLATTAIDFAIQNLSGENDVEVIVLDNGSSSELRYHPGFVADNFNIIIRRSENNIGVYPTFWWGLKEATGDVLAFLHSDMIVTEKDWDKRVLQAFSDQKLGLLGFIGSNEIDRFGGRGFGTTSNFQGDSYINSDGIGIKMGWKGSPASAHGKQDAGYSRAAVIDGCAMIFRRSVLEAIKQRENFPPHHFYDRLLSCETRELGYEVGVLGIECDHISGQTVNVEESYNDMAKDWCESHGIGRLPEDHNWDTVVYKTAEHAWLSEYRDIKHFIPCKV